MKHFYPEEKKRVVKAELPCVAADTADIELKCPQKYCKTAMAVR